MEELLKLTRENNEMLKWITSYLLHEAKHDDIQDFMHNIIANLVADRMIGGRNYAQRSY